MSKKLDPLFTTFNCFKTLFQNTKQNCVMLMDKEGFVTEINTAFTNSFGYTNDEIIGKHFGILFTQEDRKRELPAQELFIFQYQEQKF